MPTIFFLILALIFSWIHIRKHKTFNRFELCEILLTYLIFFNIGCSSLFAAIAHLFFGPVTAEAMVGLQEVHFNLKLAWPIFLMGY